MDSEVAKLRDNFLKVVQTGKDTVSDRHIQADYQLKDIFNQLIDELEASCRIYECKLENSLDLIFCGDE